MSSAEFRFIVGTIVSMDAAEQQKLLCLLGEEPREPWTAKKLLSQLAYESNDLNVAAVALRALNGKSTDSV
ncbi:MAG: hypothetical protein ACW99J_17875 [Candidatus Thorarchaeota archaeon]|jgi:hypothetical protein